MSFKFLQLVILGSITFALTTCVANADSYVQVNDKQHHGLVNSKGESSLSSQQLHQLENELRKITGYKYLKFENGALTIEKSDIEGGSATARILIADTINYKGTIELESHQNSLDISFGCSTSKIFKAGSSSIPIDIQIIKLDLTDFAKLIGDRKAIEAFSPGFVLLHELAHIVYKLKDNPNIENKAGECEGYTNIIRAELKLPIRLNYFSSLQSLDLFRHSSKSKISKLIFIQSMDGQGRLLSKCRELTVRWDVEKVGMKKVFLNQEKLREILPQKSYSKVSESVIYVWNSEKQ